MAHILVVEDEKPINELICRNLSLVGYQCVSAFDGQRAVELVKENQFDLILLDVMLPKLDGIAVFQQTRPVPAIFLTARGSLHARVEGLSLGADDYIVKPFELLELIARVEAVLRRTQKMPGVFLLDDVTIDWDSRLVKRGEETIELAPQEFGLLEALVKNQNIALSRERLLDLAWGFDFIGDTRTVDVHIQKLRKKLGWETKIRTVYKFGYRLEVGR